MILNKSFSIVSVKETVTYGSKMLKNLFYKKYFR